jgi:ribosomal protein S18 acetylase RimI-like enzyme
MLVSGSALRIRPAIATDAEALGRLGALLVSAHHQFDPARFIPAGPTTPQAYAAFLRQRLEAEDAIVLIAEHFDAVVGYAYAGIEGNDYMALRGPAGAIYDLVVTPDRRREGIGRRLLDATVAALEARNVPQIVLTTAQRNVAAQRLYAGAGFRPTMIEMTRQLG